FSPGGGENRANACGKHGGRKQPATQERGEDVFPNGRGQTTFCSPYDECSGRSVRREALSIHPKRIQILYHYLITLSAWYNTDSGTVRPICCAVRRLRTRSSLLTVSTGRSLGLVPARIR